MYTQNAKAIPSPRQICPDKAYSGPRGLGGGGGTMGLLVGQQRNGTYSPTVWPVTHAGEGRRGLVNHANMHVCWRRGRAGRKYKRESEKVP